ncbi:MAG: class I SAM-dependent methyltransferase [Candidatus Hydrogenedentes bacterium]|nr:class I SAM-dependent methyltransferase [Candidatus Hydrogenedentota bacterium]
MRTDFIDTAAHEHLIQRLIELVREKNRLGETPRVLNIGAGRHLFNETQLCAEECQFLCDRIDVDDCALSHPSIGHCWQCSAEAMTPVPSENYDLAFANYVLEHVPDLPQAAREIHRVLKPGGVLVVSVPNTAAPEFIVARWTPLWLHKRLRGGESWEKQYSYRNIREFTAMFAEAGLQPVEVRHFPIMAWYASRVPLLGPLGRAYDAAIKRMRATRLMGNVFIMFEKS